MAAAAAASIPAAAVREGRCRVWIDRDYLAQVHLKAMTPEPVRHELGADRQWFLFDIADPDERVEIVMWLAPAVRGSLSGRLGVAMQTGEGKAGDSDGAKGADDADAEREPALSFGHFVYP